MRKRLAWIMAGTLMVTLSGCAGNPEESVVKEKNMDKMLQQAQATDYANLYEEVKEEMKQYESYQKKFKDKNLHVTVNVDAKVEVPGVDKLSVYRVRAKKIKQEFLDRVRTALTPDTVYYEGNKRDARTKAVIAQEINEHKEWIRQAKKEDPERVEEYEQSLADLEKEYKTAPAKVELTDYPTDNKIKNIKDLYESDKEDSFYSWLYDLNKNGQMFYGVSDGKDGNFHALFMQNSDDYGNCLRYESGKNWYVDQRIYSAFVDSDIPSIVLKEEGKEPDFSDNGKGIEMEGGANVQCVDNEPLTLTEADAEQKVTVLLKQLGLEDYQCYDKGVYAQLIKQGDDGSQQYRNIYRFLCLRKLDDVFVSNLAGYKMTDGFQGGQHVKKVWGNEGIAVAVNDSGIVGFHYLSPLSVDETVVEMSRVKPFREIKDTFEKMVVIENAPDSTESEGEPQDVSVQVTNVRLIYTRISEKDSFDTGLVVPVWNFEGTVTDEYGTQNKGTVLSINAIDGSVINQELGY